MASRSGLASSRSSSRTWRPYRRAHQLSTLTAA